MHKRPIPLALAAGALLAALVQFAARGQERDDARLATELPQLFESLSEPGGYFDTDNLISNETSYLQVADLLERYGRKGGVYVGVGPEQNFSYVARLRPSWAFIVDVRRDNALQHLYFNALFEAAPDPVQYLCRLLSRPCPELTPEAARGGVAAALEALEGVEPRSATFRRVLADVLAHVEHHLGVALSAADRETLAGVHRSFFREQLGLRFRSHGRRPMPYHPTLRSLLLARSPSGRFGSFLDSQADYAAVRELERAGRLVPVVGDFAGDHSLRALGALLRARGLTVSAFYVSNVEFYLIRAGRYDAFLENLRALPLDPDSLFIRAYFDYGRAHPARLPGHRSTTVVQPIRRFLERYPSDARPSHWEISTVDILQ